MFKGQEKIHHQDTRNTKFHQVNFLLFLVNLVRLVPWWFAVWY